MLQLPFKQLWIVQVAPAAHSIRQPTPQVSMVHVEPFAQFWMLQPPGVQSGMAQVAPSPHTLMLQPPCVQAPM